MMSDGERIARMQELESLPFTIPHLHAAYRGGLSPAAIVEEVARRIDLARPGVLHLGRFAGGVEGGGRDARSV
jgi:hypothetical protein